VPARCRSAGPTTCRWNRTGSGGHYAADARTFAKWGVSFVKADNCHHPDLPPPVYYGNMSAGLNASGWPMHFNLCEWGDDHVWTWGGSIAQVRRRLRRGSGSLMPEQQQPDAGAAAA